MNRRTKRKYQKKSQRKTMKRRQSKKRTYHKRSNRKQTNRKQSIRKQSKRKRTRQYGGDNAEFKSVMLNILNDTYIPFIPTSSVISDPDLQANYLKCVSAFDLLTIIGKNPKFSESKSISGIVKEVDTDSKEIFNLLGDLTKVPVSQKVMSNFMINCNGMKKNEILKQLREYILECEDKLSHKYVNWYKVTLGLISLDPLFESQIKEEIEQRRIYLDTDKFKYGLDILLNDKKVKNMFKTRILECGYKPQGFFDKLMGKISWDSYDECFKCSGNNCFVELDENYKSFLNKPHKIKSIDKIKILIYIELRLRAFSKYISLEGLRIMNKKYSKVKSLLNAVYRDDMNRGNKNRNSFKQMVMKPFLGGAADGNQPNQPASQPPLIGTLSSEGDAQQPVSNPSITLNPLQQDSNEQPMAEQPMANQPDLGNVPLEGTPDQSQEVAAPGVVAAGVAADVAADVAAPAGITPDTAPAAAEGVVAAPATEGVAAPAAVEGVAEPVGITSAAAPTPINPGAVPATTVLDPVAGTTGLDQSPESVVDTPVTTDESTTTTTGEEQQTVEQVEQPMVEQPMVEQPMVEQPMVDQVEQSEQSVEQVMVDQTAQQPDSNVNEGNISSTSVIYLTFNTEGVDYGGNINDLKDNITNEIKREIRNLTGANEDTIKIYRIRFGPVTISVEVGIIITGIETMTDTQIKEKFVEKMVDGTIKASLHPPSLGLIKDIYFDGISEFEGVKGLPSEYKRVTVDIPGRYPDTEEFKYKFEETVIENILEFLGLNIEPIRIQIERVKRVPKDDSRITVQFLIMDDYEQIQSPNQILMEFIGKYRNGETFFEKQYNLTNVSLGKPSIVLDGSETDMTDMTHNLLNEEKKQEDFDPTSLEGLENKYKQISNYGCSDLVDAIRNKSITSNTPLFDECENTVSSMFGN